jgi:phospholipase D1/2
MTILQPGRNVWRIEPARRFAFFHDVAGCFGAMRSAMQKAERSITIVGWDIDSRTRLVGDSGEAKDGCPAELGPFLQELAQRKPTLRINLLLWDYASIYALEREAFPRVKLAWDRANLVLDDCLPLGSSQHQKIVLIDDGVAFAGGLDVTIRRWDTAHHGLRDKHRVDPSGNPYNPFHDVQAVVDGPAAAALAELVRERWRCASGEMLPVGDPREVWPAELEPAFRDVQVGIARTVPAQENVAESREVQQLFFDMIDAAEVSLYIENQFLTSLPVAQHIAERLAAKPQLEVLIIAPKTHHSWLEAVAMRHGRIRFQEIIRAADLGDRVRFVYPRVAERSESVDVMVHSKVMIVDDRLLRIGSANLNNRSMGADSECDLVIEARSDAEREAISAARSRLLAMHCGVSEADAAEALRSQSLIAVSRMLGTNSRGLEDIDDGGPERADYPGFLDAVADPERPIDAEAFIAMTSGEQGPGLRLRAGFTLVLFAALILSLAGVWAVFSQEADAAVRDVLQLTVSDWTTPFVVVGVFLVGAALMVPVTLMIIGASATLGLVWGLTYAALGTLVSAAVFYGLGAWLGTGVVRRVTGGRLGKVRDAIRRGGVLAIAAIRVVPLAPFSFINLAAGATSVGFWPFIVGTALGMAPGFIVLSALGDRLYRLVSEPTVVGIAIVFALLLLWLATLLFAQHWARRHMKAA